jgi:sulfur carrier protein ThiS
MLLPQRKRVELAGRRRVSDLLKELNLVSGTVLVIRGDELVTEHDFLDADDIVEVRNVISGG